jgi:hypothetical protein
MIPLPFLTGPKFWLKVGGIAAVVAVLGFGVAKYNYHHDRSVRLDAVEAQAKRDRQAYTDTLAAYETRQKAANAVLQTLEDANAKLRAAAIADGPAPKLRVCKQSPVPASPPKDGGTPGSDGPAERSDVPRETELDTGTIYQLMDEADQLAARLRACQSLLK